MPAPKRAPIHLAPNDGRPYPMGPLRAVFKADGAETRGRYSISEWWLDPYTKGPGAHSHSEDDVFYVLEGTLSFWLGDRWIDAKKGSFVLAPGGMKHDFENRTAKRAGMLNVSVPGEFEETMPGIAAWFRARTTADTRTANALSAKGRNAKARAPDARAAKARSARKRPAR
jgi:mannose-6-phosphate isomerase-like protein (cupin superfamily)